MSEYEIHDLGKVSRRKIRRLRREQPGGLMAEVQAVVNGVVEEKKAEGKEVVPVVVLYQQKRRRRRGRGRGGLPFPLPLPFSFCRF
jgi:hypothetical protein